MGLGSRPLGEPVARAPVMIPLRMKQRAELMSSVGVDGAELYSIPSDLPMQNGKIHCLIASSPIFSKVNYLL
jgi:hypothetical protein